MRIVVTDLHFGAKGNSLQHCDDLLTFFRYVIDWCQTNHPGVAFGVDILGDFFQHRDKIDVAVMNKATEGLQILSEFFTDIRMLKGNHDLYYRDTRAVSSLEAFKTFPNVNVVDWYEIDGDCMYVSWVCNAEEYDEIINVSKANKIKYMFGHFEFTSFAMNDHYIMEHGYSHKYLRHLKKVYTGHYHKHQTKDNVDYIGTPFPIDMNDANDVDRGFLVFDPATGRAERKQYEGVMVVSIPFREFLSTDWEPLSDVTIRVVIDEEIDDETQDKIKERLETGGFRETKLTYNLNKSNDLLGNESEANGTEPQNIDKLVMEHIDGMKEIDGIDRELLKKIYMESKALHD